MAVALWIGVLPMCGGAMAQSRAAEDSSLLNQIEQSWSADPALSERLLREAIIARPTDAHLYLLLGALRERQSPLQAATLITIGERLAPQSVSIRLSAAAFWARQGELNRALANWDRVLRLKPALGNQLFPLLVQIGQDGDSRGLLRALAEQDPPWWSEFFPYFAEHASSLEPVRGFYGWRELVAADVPAAEAQAMLERLYREGRWIEAYFAWLNGLETTDLASLSYIFNGRFEVPLSNIGFGWRARPADELQVRAALVEDGYGKRSLQVKFGGGKLQFQHLEQFLVLGPGRYQFSGSVRAISLRDTPGLQWSLHCVAGSAEPLLKTKEFTGNMPWQLFHDEFSVPEHDCQVQRLRLEQIEPMPVATKGEIWFDNLAIKRRAAKSS